MVIYLRADSMYAMMLCENTRDVHAKFSYWEKLYGENLELVENADDDELHVTYHKECALRCFLLSFVGTSIFVDKSATYIDVAYLKYFINLSAIHEWNWGACMIRLSMMTSTEHHTALIRILFPSTPFHFTLDEWHVGRI